MSGFDPMNDGESGLGLGGRVFHAIRLWLSRALS